MRSADRERPAAAVSGGLEAADRRGPVNGPSYFRLSIVPLSRGCAVPYVVADVLVHRDVHMTTNVIDREESAITIGSPVRVPSVQQGSMSLPLPSPEDGLRENEDPQSVDF
jgi:hypothetical protein